MDERTEEELEGKMYDKYWEGMALPEVKDISREKAGQLFMYLCLGRYHSVLPKEIEANVGSPTIELIKNSKKVVDLRLYPCREELFNILYEKVMKFFHESGGDYLRKFEDLRSCIEYISVLGSIRSNSD